MKHPWIAFVPYAAVSIVHVGALAVGADAVAGPTKLALMPLLALGVVLVVGRAGRRGLVLALLLTAIALSWLGDGAAVFFPFAPTLPMMLLCFGLAHLCYIWLFGRRLAVRRVPWWALVYAVWWVGVLVVLWPHLGDLSIAVAVYGLVLGGTAVAASRCHPLIAWGGAVFLSSDTILAFRIFLPDAMPDWTSPLVMVTYTVGQCLLAVGAIIALRAAAARSADESAPVAATIA
ncbi:lysoplasmalogenase family protein [Microbacterium sp. BWT-B31]|uniref:lysoplasmalogenase family protein n=1 Tax=Microbacterium sp. BWT-B31 TaxID=3232072 RepID=UPI0035283B5A